MRLAVLSLCLLSSVALAQEKGQAEAEKAAEASAGAWLKLVDAEKYGESWAEDRPCSRAR